MYSEKKVFQANQKKIFFFSMGNAKTSALYYLFAWYRFSFSLSGKTVATVLLLLVTLFWWEFFQVIIWGGGEYSQWSWNKKLGHKFKVIYPYCFKALGSVWQLAFHRLWGQLCQSPSGLTACFLYDQEDATYVEILLFCLNCNLVMNSLNKACW